MPTFLNLQQQSIRWNRLVLVVWVYEKGMWRSQPRLTAHVHLAGQARLFANEPVNLLGSIAFERPDPPVTLDGQDVGYLAAALGWHRSVELCRADDGTAWLHTPGFSVRALRVNQIRWDRDNLGMRGAVVFLPEGIRVAEDSDLNLVLNSENASQLERLLDDPLWSEGELPSDSV